VLVSIDGDREVEFSTALTIGRSPLNDLELDHPRVSSRHAVIEWNGVQWRLRDLGSSNGTSVNRRRIRGPKGIEPGNVLRFAGTSRWRVEKLEPPVESDGLAPTEKANSEPDAGDLILHLSFDSPDGGQIRLVRAGVEWNTHARQRFILLYLLAQAAGSWLPDTDLKLKLWGRAGIDAMSPNSLHKLIHDVRQLFRDQGIGGWIIQKERGKTRLALSSERIRLNMGHAAGAQRGT